MRGVEAVEGGEERREAGEGQTSVCSRWPHGPAAPHTSPPLNSVPQYSINIFAFSLIAAPLRIYEDFVLNGKLG